VTYLGGRHTTLAHCCRVSILRDNQLETALEIVADGADDVTALNNGFYGARRPAA
jgi:hypothetical protein